MMDNNETITLRRKDFFRIIKELAIHRKHLSSLFSQVYGMKDNPFGAILKEMAEDFGVPYEELDNVSFERFENGN